MGVKKPWLQMFDNTGEYRDITVDIGTQNISRVSVSDSTAPSSTTIANFDNSNGNNNPTLWVSSVSGTNAAIESKKLALTDSTGAGSTTYTGPEFDVATNNDTFVSFKYSNSGYTTGDKFVWKLQKLEGGEFKTVQQGGNTDAEKSTVALNLQTGIVSSGTYRLVFEVEDKNNDGSYKVFIDDIKLNKSAGNDTIVAKGGNPDIVLNKDQLQYALQAGGLFPTPIELIGNNLVGGAGDDVIFGDSINTDWLEWTGRDLNAANSPDAAGSSMAALKKYLDMLKANNGSASLPQDSTFTFEGGGSVTDKDIDNFIKLYHEEFSAEGATIGGNDTITGGAGADIIYGQGGNDTITTDLHTDGDDIKGDLLIDGGTGIDTLILEQDFNIDFSKLDSGKNAADRIKNIEEIDLTTGKHELLNLKLSDVLAMTDDNNELIIKGDGDDKVSFDATNSGIDANKTTTETIDGVDFTVYTNEEETVKLKVQTDILI